MDRKGHYLKPGVRATAPGVIMVVVPSPSIRTVNGDESNLWYEWGGADVVYSARRAGRWSPVRQQRCETTAELHATIEQWACSRRRNYVITPDGAETAAQVRLWDHIDRGRVRYAPQHVGQVKANGVQKGNYATIIRRVAVSPRCFILDYQRSGKRLVWLSGNQYFDAGEDALQKASGVEWCDSGDWYAPGTYGVRTPRERACVWLAVFQRLSDWWLTHAKAPFGLTGSALSFGILRTHVAPKALCTHALPDVHQMERDACFGGMARTFYFGDVGRCPYSLASAAPPRSQYGSIPGPMHHIDVRSMYPSILRDMVFPTKHKANYGDITPQQLLGLCTCRCMIARVTIETPVAEYPERVNGLIFYRTGRFTTTLTGPELEAIAREGKIVKVHYATTYVPGRPFRSAATALIRMREDARRSDPPQPAWELFAKLIGNGLGGKLAQRKGQWQHRERVPALMRYGEWTDVSSRGRSQTRYRGIAGITWEWVSDQTGEGPYTAAFAYLTAYGRLHLRRLREMCPERSVLSIDTDGLWVTSAAMDGPLGASCDPCAQAGGHRCDKSSDYGRFFGPRHYWSQAGWILAGMTVTGPVVGGSMVPQAKRYTPLGGRDGGAPRGTSVRTLTSPLKVECHGVSIGRDGWAKPTHKRHG